ncbi:MAG: NlpC/P60 family protein, partial [Escherichia sp.]
DTDNQFIHASTSQGVTRSSLDNVYWHKNFWQARRI